MKEKINIGVETLRIIYSRYKKYMIYWGVILVCFFVFVFFVVARIIEIPKLSKERSVELGKFKILNNNLTLLRAISESDLDSKFEVASKALPSNKDFQGIINAISLASSKSGASLNDYSFYVGDLSKGSDVKSGFPFVKLTLTLKGTPRQTVSFLKNLSETFPLSEVESITQKGGTVSITTFFYYKSAVPSNYSGSRRLAGISTDHAMLIEKISSWDTSFASFLAQPSGTSSASPF